MQVHHLKREFDRLQEQYGCPTLKAIYGAGCIKQPRVCLIFMNPTARNAAADPDWTGLRAPWIGTKNVWKLLSSTGLIASTTNKIIQGMSPQEWTPAFAKNVYGELQRNGVYVTNLSKATQADARPLSNTVFKAYLDLLIREIAFIKPTKIITFGNQVSSILLKKAVTVSSCRRESYPLSLLQESIPVFPVYYPVGQGMRNLPAAIEDMKIILKT